MLHGLMELSDEFLIPQVPTTDGNWLYDVFFQLRLDHPEIFWAVGFKYRYYKDSPNLILIPEYIFDKNKIREHQKALGARVDKLVRTAMKFSEWDKEKYVHDFICENIRYDKLKKPYSHEIIGPLGHGVGVCEGIAKSVKVLCDALGVWCIIAICGNNPEKGIKYRHTWNIVRINGQYYHLDATFDNTLGKNEDGSTSIRYDYFNLDDKNIFRDHEPLIAPAPPCPDGNHFYYREKKLSFTKLEDVYKRALQAAKKGREFTFHWRGGYLTRIHLCGGNNCFCFSFQFPGKCITFFFCPACYTQFCKYSICLTTLLNCYTGYSTAADYKYSAHVFCLLFYTQFS